MLPLIHILLPTIQLGHYPPEIWFYVIIFQQVRIFSQIVFTIFSYLYFDCLAWLTYIVHDEFYAHTRLAYAVKVRIFSIFHWYHDQWKIGLNLFISMYTIQILHQHNLNTLILKRIFFITFHRDIINMHTHQQTIIYFL